MYQQARRDGLMQDKTGDWPGDHGLPPEMTGGG
jgi:hypothetical protein